MWRAVAFDFLGVDIVPTKRRVVIRTRVELDVAAAAAKATGSEPTPTILYHTQDELDAAVTAAAAAEAAAGACKLCGSGEDEASLLLCDGCDGAHHLTCIRPLLNAVPEGEWYCEVCCRRNAAAIIGVDRSSPVTIRNGENNDQ